MDVPEAVRRADPGSGESTIDEEPTAQPEGPHPDRDPGDDDLPELEESDDSDGWSLFGWLKETPEGSYREMDARDFWDPEGGGRNRIAFHLSDLVGARGLPNGVGLLVGLLEEYYRLAQAQNGGGDDSSSGGGDADGYPEIEEASAL